ncbi:aquaporin [Micromonospora inaquosa]
MCRVKFRLPGWPLAWIVGGLFGLQGAILGTLMGGSANPARQLGPALLSGEVHLLAVYLIAPITGGLLAGWIAGHFEYRHRPRDVYRFQASLDHGSGNTDLMADERGHDPNATQPVKLLRPAHELASRA